MRRFLAVVSLAALVVGSGVSEPRAARAEAPAPTDFEALMAAVSPAVVSVRFNVAIAFSVAGQAGSHRQRTQTRGVIVDPSGLVVTSDSRTGGPNSPMIKAALSMLPGVDLKIDVEDLQVVLGENAEELPAVVVARDGRNDVAWLQVVGLGDRRLPAVDLGKSRDPRVGEEVAMVSRVGRGFGYAAVLAKSRVGSLAERPRRSWALTSEAGVPGMLWFDLRGAPVGLLYYQSGTEGDDEESPTLRLLPMDVVRRSFEQAKKKVPEALEKAGSSKPAEGR